MHGLRVWIATPLPLGAPIHWRADPPTWLRPCAGDTLMSNAKGWNKLWVVLSYASTESLPVVNVSDGAGLRLGTPVEIGDEYLASPAMGYVYA